MKATHCETSNPIETGTELTTMAGSRRKMIILAVVIMAAGTGWLLNTLKLFPEIDWIWTGGLAFTGILIMAAAGLNRITFVIGPFLVACSATSLLRQLGKLRPDIEAPVLCIVFGTLLLLAHVLPLRVPAFLRENLAQNDTGQ